VVVEVIVIGGVEVVVGVEDGVEVVVVVVAE
jgi:hypothetical protein